MANMSESQESLISQLQYARVIYDKFEEDLLKEVADRKWEAKTHIRQLVREARAINVPYSKIGYALQTRDHNTIKNYESDTRR